MDKRSAYCRYVDARAARLKNASPPAMQELREAILELLQSGEAFPDELRLQLARAFENVVSGVADALFTPTARPGHREPPLMKRAQEDAIRYLRWCEVGKIEDPSPMNTVAVAHQVALKTVHNWRRAWADRAVPALFAGDPEAETAAAVEEFMRISGAHYRAAAPARVKSYR